AASRLGKAENALKDAVDSANKNFEGLGQTKTAAGKVVVLVIRPQEVVAAVQALAQAYNDYFGAVADYDRAQFRLYRALGHPAHLVARPELGGPGSPPECLMPAASALPISPGTAKPNPDP